ncbi:hypothetical protein KIN20_032900 [Parelaphostrongylus tenuis]|uniref:Uncharacterized protein n=1 Tax=Parelaphostrongylus tenuis TaxID=148309 RepID=A0AAD5WIC8_PARTN|nr:hypothetical protein KIN20_032900 [Parelaphostrongylus tenuis]
MKEAINFTKQTISLDNSQQYRNSGLVFTENDGLYEMFDPHLKMNAADLECRNFRHMLCRYTWSARWCSIAAFQFFPLLVQIFPLLSVRLFQVHNLGITK